MPGYSTQFATFGKKTQMKKTALAVLAICSLAFSCKKKDASTSTSPAYDSLKYIVNNIKDITVQQYQDSIIYLPIELEYKSGIQESLNVTMTGLPTGGSLTPTTISGIPTFSSNFMLNYFFTTSGTYPITVTASSAKSGAKSFNFNLNVMPRTCAYGLVGNYDGTCNFTSDTTTTATRTAVKGADDSHVTLYTYFGTFNAAVDCSNMTFSIPETTPSGSSTTYRATGSFTGKLVTINWTLTSMLVPFSCREKWVRK